MQWHQSTVPYNLQSFISNNGKNEEDALQFLFGNGKENISRGKVITKKLGRKIKQSK